MSSLCHKPTDITTNRTLGLPPAAVNHGGAFRSRHRIFVSHLKSLAVPLSLAGCLKRGQAAERFDHPWLRPGKGLGWRDIELESCGCSSVDGNTKTGQAPS
ncbi:hypothetical protein ABVK25_007866 [Lepraria finkii]|uniref:Uncharacterized protein n=1 Tax=Lepraria finkii TaxID=1340010 RepID=A0ABR4B4K1_9LECA